MNNYDQERGIRRSAFWTLIANVLAAFLCWCLVSSNTAFAQNAERFFDRDPSVVFTRWTVTSMIATLAWCGMCIRREPRLIQFVLAVLGVLMPAFSCFPAEYIGSVVGAIVNSFLH
jgi:hypothetical protein